MMLNVLKSWLKPSATGKTRHANRLGMTYLEDRCTPASIAGNVITLDDAGEMLTIATFANGQVSVASTVDVNGGSGTVTFAPSGPLSIVDTATGTSVLFGDSPVEFSQLKSVQALRQRVTFTKVTH